MTDLEQVLVELRSQIEKVAYPIQQLSSSGNQLDEKYSKLTGILNWTYAKVIAFLDSVPSSPLFTIRDPDFMLYLRHDMRNPLSILISVATIIEELHGVRLNSEQREAAHSIEHIANDLINYLNTFD